MSHTLILHAQWTAADSVKLQQFLTGKDTLRLNPETMKAIENGTFLNLQPELSQPSASPLQLPLVKDFREYLDMEEEESRMIVPFYLLPPMVMRRYRLPELPEPKYKISPGLFALPKNFEAVQPSGRDFAHTLNMLFSREYRQHYKNSLNVPNLKHYGTHWTIEEEKTKRKYLDDLERLPTPMVRRRSTPVDTLATGRSSVGQDSIAAVVQADSLANRTQPL
ncbi:DUF4858 domain-containing protein [Parabacteroides sp. OttesenSCG-928-N08]|nr:DUF4858 domain-containing protein [Parabacteroides sp. OttesenSCG-928-N08]